MHRRVVNLALLCIDHIKNVQGAPGSIKSVVTNLHCSHKVQCCKTPSTRQEAKMRRKLAALLLAARSSARIKFCGAHCSMASTATRTLMLEASYASMAWEVDV